MRLTRTVCLSMLFFMVGQSFGADLIPTEGRFDKPLGTVSYQAAGGPSWSDDLDINLYAVKDESDKLNPYRLVVEIGKGGADRSYVHWTTGIRFDDFVGAKRVTPEQFSVRVKEVEQDGHYKNSIERRYRFLYKAKKGTSDKHLSYRKIR